MKGDVLLGREEAAIGAPKVFCVPHLLEFWPKIFQIEALCDVVGYGAFLAIGEFRIGHEVLVEQTGLDESLQRRGREWVGGNGVVDLRGVGGGGFGHTLSRYSQIVSVTKSN